MAHDEIIEAKVDVPRLKLGMYVCRLDRPWLETPYEMQGFRIGCMEDVERLAQFCQFVFIDEVRSVHAGRRERPNYSYLPRMVNPESRARLDRLGYRSMRGEDRPMLPPVEYPAPISLAKELPRARVAWKQARAWLNQAIARAKSGKPLALEELDEAAEQVVASVVRSPDAAMWLAALRRQEPYPTSHPLNCCALLMVYSRFLGFPPELLQSLAKGALLMDIGMWRLRQNYYISRDEAGPDALEDIHEHVLRGLEYLEQSGFVDFDARLMILHHHERCDGTGYPRGVRGVKLSLMGYMLHVIDAFDAICSRRAYRAEANLNTAQRSLYAERDQTVPAEVLACFFQSLGVYPTGSLVELSNGAIAAVSGQVAASKLYPRLIPLTDHSGAVLPEYAEVDSAELIAQLPSVRIVRGLPLQACPVRLDTLEPKVEPD